MGHFKRDCRVRLNTMAVDGASGSGAGGPGSAGSVGREEFVAMQ